MEVRFPSIAGIIIHRKVAVSCNMNQMSSFIGTLLTELRLWPITRLLGTVLASLTVHNIPSRRRGVNPQNSQTDPPPSPWNRIPHISCALRSELINLETSAKESSVRMTSIVWWTVVPEIQYNSQFITQSFTRMSCEHFVSKVNFICDVLTLLAII